MTILRRHRAAGGAGAAPTERPLSGGAAVRAAAAGFACVLAAIAPASAAVEGAPAPGVVPAANVPSVITLREPQIKGLISVDESLNPFDLEGASQEPLSLAGTLRLAMDRNLDIGISRTQERQQHWRYVGAIGGFLPDINSGYSLYALSGKLALPFSSPGTGGGATKVSLPSHFNLLNAGFTYNGYQGGRIVFTALENMHLLRAQRAVSRYTISDVLLKATQQYYELLRNEALLEVRIRAVDISEEQLRINRTLEQNGLATNLDVLQSETQLSRDRQELINQQIARRAAAIQLAVLLNLNPAVDVIPTDRSVMKVRLFSRALRAPDYVTMAIEHRPELKRYEELRLAARNAIPVAAAGLQPTLKLTGNVYGFGQDLGHMTPFYVLAMSANWSLHGLGLTDASAIQTARWQARQRLLESNRELEQVMSEVRDAFLGSLKWEQQIVETAKEVASAQEELRLAKLRFEHGLGANIDVITAQRDLTNALVDRVQAMIGYNIAQAQLLHDTGLINVQNLTDGKVISTPRT